MRNASKPPRKALSELEHVIMRFLWSHGPANSEQVREGLASQRPMKDATVRTILRRLEEKGYVKHRLDGRTYIYSGVERPESVAVRAVRQIMDRFLSGSVEHEVIGRRELENLAKKIARRKEQEKK